VTTEKHKLQLMGAFAAAASLSRKARALLAYLALHPDTPVPRERLCGMLWSERGEDQARGSLRQCLRELRAFASSPYPLINIGRFEVTLWGERAITDLDEIRSLSNAADATGLADRLSIADGRLLANLDGLDPAFDEWLTVQRAALESQVRAMATACVHAALRSRPANALRLAEAIAARDPLDEAAARLAMTAAHAAGEQGEMRRIWNRLETALHDDLGVRPSSESADAYAALMADSAAGPAAQYEDPAGTPARGRASIAVLPFADLTAAGDQGYFCDGMVVEIATALSRFASLLVISPSSSLTYRDPATARGGVAAELGVRYLLEGSLRRAAGQVRIAVQLIDTAGAQIWSERFNGAPDDIFALQDAVAIAVAGQIAPSIHAAEMRRLSGRPTQDLGAYELYLRAYQHAQMNTHKALEEAIALLDEAMRRDPAYAIALAFAGFCHAITLAYGWADAPREAVGKAVDLARLAVRADGEDPEVLFYAASVTAIVGGDLATAEAMIERSLERNPGAAIAWQTSGWIKVLGGRPDLGLDRFDRAARIDPRSGWLTAHALAGRGCCLLCLGRFDEATVPLAEAADRLPGQRGARIWLAAALAHAGRVPEARLALRGAHGRAIEASLAFIRDGAARELIRTGLRLAGADA
jgi:TolB-like protein